MAHEFERDLVALIGQYAERMGVYVEVAGQRKAKGSGSTKGLTDIFIAVAGWYIPCEVKNGDKAPVRRDQIWCAEKRADKGCPTAWLRDIDDFVVLVNWCRKNPRKNPPLPQGIRWWKT